MASLDSGSSNLNIDGNTSEFTDFGGLDTYTILPSLSGNVVVTDNNASIINLPAGLNVTNALFLSDGVQFTVNGFTVTFIGNPALFTYKFGGTPIDPAAGTSLDFDATAAAFGTTVPAAGSTANNGTTTGGVNADGSVGTGGGGGTDQTFTLTAGTTSVDEGATASFTLTTTNVPEGAEVAYTITGVSAADITGPLTGTATVGADGTATISVALAEDALTEGTETLTVALDNGEATADVTVNDTSLTSVFELTAGTTSVDEGATASFTLTTTNVPEGAEVAYTITGVSAADITGPLTGTATVGADGTATISVALAEDALTEGTETLTVALDNGEATADVTVNDTSLTSVFELTAGTTSVDEGATASFTLTTTNVPEGAEVAYTITGVSAADITGPLTGTATVGADGTATISVALAEDALTEGTETLTVALDNGEATAGVTVNDTSMTPEQAVTINLTTATDQPGGGGTGVDTQGTSSNDTYLALVENTGGTLQSSDNIAAGDGIDTLTVRVISLTGTQTVTPVATGLESIVINNQSSSGDFRLNFSDISGEAEVTAARNSANAVTRFINLETDTKIRLVDNDGVTTAHLKGDRSASTDKVTFYIEDSGTGTGNAAAFFQTLNETTTAIDQGFEIAEIETGGTTQSFLDLNNMTLDSVMVTGTQTLTLEDTTGNFATLKSADASGMTAGGLNLDASGATQTSFSFTGSGEADSLEVTRTFLENATTLSLNGGAGLDKLIVNSVTNIASAVNTATSFEMLEITGSIPSLAAGDFTSINTFIFAGQRANSGSLNISGVEGDDKFVFTSDQGGNDNTVNFRANTSTAVTFELEAQSGPDGEIRIVTNSNGSNNGAIGFNPSGGGNNNINAVNIISSGSNAEANVIRAEDKGFNHYAFNNENGPSTFNISGSQALTITAEVGVDLNTQDEFGFEAPATVDGSNAEGDLRIAGSASNTGDRIDGGSGNDIFYGLTGDDELTGNGGSDQFRMIDDNDTDTIMDFAAGEDKIGLEQVDFQNTTASSAGTELSMLDYIDNRTSISNLNSSDNQKVVELTSAASGGQIAADVTTNAVEAYVLVFNSTSGKGELWYDDNWSDMDDRFHLAVFDNITDLVGLTGLSNTDFVEYTF